MFALCSSHARPMERRPPQVPPGVRGAFPGRRRLRPAPCGAALGQGLRVPRLRRDEGLGAEGGRCRRECADCGRQTSVTAGTVMHRSHLPLRTWFLAAHLMATHSNGISALHLQAQLGIGSYKSAWLPLRKLRRAMVDPDRSPLQGIAEVDGASMPCRDGGGGEGGGERGVAGRGRSAAGRIPVAGAVELSEDGSSRRIRLETVGDYGAEALHGFIAGAVAPGAWTVTDGWSGYTGLPDSPRGRRVAGGRPAHKVLSWIHRVFPDLRRWAMGVYHGLRRKRAQRYLDEFVLRWNRRRHRRTSFERLLGIGLGLPPATYRDLTDVAA